MEKNNKRQISSNKTVITRKIKPPNYQEDGDEEDENSSYPGEDNYYEGGDIDYDNGGNYDDVSVEDRQTNLANTVESRYQESEKKFANQAKVIAHLENRISVQPNEGIRRMLVKVLKEVRGMKNKGDINELEAIMEKVSQFENERINQKPPTTYSIFFHIVPETGKAQWYCCEELKNSTIESKTADDIDIIRSVYGDQRIYWVQDNTTKKMKKIDCSHLSLYDQQEDSKFLKEEGAGKNPPTNPQNNFPPPSPPQTKSLSSEEILGLLSNQSKETLEILNDRDEKRDKRDRERREQEKKDGVISDQAKQIQELNLKLTTLVATPPKANEGDGLIGTVITSLTEFNTEKIKAEAGAYANKDPQQPLTLQDYQNLNKGFIDNLKLANPNLFGGGGGGNPIVPKSFSEELQNRNKDFEAIKNMAGIKEYGSTGEETGPQKVGAWGDVINDILENVADQAPKIKKAFEKDEDDTVNQQQTQQQTQQQSNPQQQQPAQQKNENQVMLEKLKQKSKSEQKKWFKKAKKYPAYLEMLMDKVEKGTNPLDQIDKIRAFVSGKSKAAAWFSDEVEIINNLLKLDYNSAKMQLITLLNWNYTALWLKPYTKAELYGKVYMMFAQFLNTAEARAYFEPIFYALKGKPVTHVKLETTSIPKSKKPLKKRTVPTKKVPTPTPTPAPEPGVKKLPTAEELDKDIAGRMQKKFAPKEIEDPDDPGELDDSLDVDDNDF